MRPPVLERIERGRATSGRPANSRLSKTHSHRRGPKDRPPRYDFGNTQPGALACAPGATGSRAAYSDKSMILDTLKRTRSSNQAAAIVPRGVVYESWILARSTRAQLTTADNRAG